MQNKKALVRWFFVLLSIVIISLILWNTYAFFNQLKENERGKMRIWATAQEELASADEISEMVVKVLESNTTTPMVLYSHKEDTYDVRNINEKKADSGKIQLQRKNLAEKFTSEYKPIEVYYKDELLQTIYYGNSPIINKLKYYPAVLILIIALLSRISNAKE